MVDLRSLNLSPLNQQAAQHLQQAKHQQDKKTQLAVAQLMLWALDSNLLEQPPAWAAVTNFSDRHLDWAGLIRDMEANQPQVLMELLTKTDSGDDYEIDLDDLEADEAAATLLEELIVAVQAQPDKLHW